MLYKFLSILILSSLFSQDIAGNYEFRGLYAIYQNIARYNTSINASDIHNLNLTLPIDQIDAGEIFRTTYQGPYGYATAVALNVNINVSFYENGTGSILEGSILPTDDVDLDNCTVATIFEAFTDELIYSSDLNAGSIVPSTNIVGYIPNANNDPIAIMQGYVVDGLVVGYENTLQFEGQSAGSISLSQSATFDFFPSTPVHPTLCDSEGNCFDVILEDGTVINGGDPLPGFAGGYALKGNLPSIAPSENVCADLYLEWHAIDGPIAGTGLGDQIGVDEDGDGTDFDRTWAMEKIQVTSLELGCGYNYPVAGDLSLQENMLGLSENCVGSLDKGNDFYIMDSNFSSYGNFLTYNAYYGLPGDDSDHDFNGSDGRLVWQFSPMCIDAIMVRQIMLEFLEIGSDDSCINCLHPGDLNDDGSYNVLDIVGLANCVLAADCNGCQGDLNVDGSYNVLDIVALANCVLAASCDS